MTYIHSPALSTLLWLHHNVYHSPTYSEYCSDHAVNKIIASYQANVDLTGYVVLPCLDSEKGYPSPHGTSDKHPENKEVNKNEDIKPLPGVILFVL